MMPGLSSSLDESLGLSSPATTAAQNHRRGINPAQRAGSKAVRPTPRDRVNLSAVGCLESAESRTPGFCALCKSRYGSILSRGTAVLSVRSSRTPHPTGQSLCVPKRRERPRLAAYFLERGIRANRVGAQAHPPSSPLLLCKYRRVQSVEFFIVEARPVAPRQASFQ